MIYSPEREDPSNEDFNTKNIPKIVSGITDSCLEVGLSLYTSIIDQVIPVSSVKVAEMAKLLENIDRAVNIGMINETDVSLAKASNAILIGFNVKPNREAKKLAEEQKIDIKYLHSSKILKKKYEKIKILGQGEIKDKLNLEVHYLSNSAKEKLSKNGSTIKILESK